MIAASCMGQSLSQTEYLMFFTRAYHRRALCRQQRSDWRIARRIIQLDCYAQSSSKQQHWPFRYTFGKHWQLEGSSAASRGQHWNGRPSPIWPVRSYRAPGPRDQCKLLLGDAIIGFQQIGERDPDHVKQQYLHGAYSRRVPKPAVSQ